MPSKKKNLIGAAGAVIIAGGIFFATHDFISGGFYPKSAKTIDLTAKNVTAQDYAQLCQRFPGKEILWSIPFQGSRYAADTEFIALTSLTKEEADDLALFPQLEAVDASLCRDYDALLYLMQQNENLQVTYQVSVGGTEIDSAAQEASISAADAQAFPEVAVYLPQLSQLTVEGEASVQTLLTIRQSNPSLTVLGTYTLAGQSVTPDTRKLDFSGVKMDYDDLSDTAPLLTGLEKLILTDSGLTNEQCKAVADALPETIVVWQMPFAGSAFSTDSREIDISGASVTVPEVDEAMPYFRCLDKLIMSDCGIDNETMEALNLRYPDTKIVWTLKIGLVTLRTDATVFYPAKISESQMPSNEEVKKLRFCHDMIAVDIGESHVSECEWLEAMPHLKYLILAYTDITDLTPLSSLKELIYLELFVMDLEDYSPLLGCTALQDLNLGSTYGDPEPISKMTWLHNLQWNHGGDVPEHHDAVMALADQLPDTNVTIDTFRNIGGLWRNLPNYYIFRELIGANYFNQINTTLYWGSDASKILATDHNRPAFAGDVLAEIIRRRIDNGESIPGVKNIGSEKAEILYQTMVESAQWYQK